MAARRLIRFLEPIASKNVQTEPIISYGIQNLADPSHVRRIKGVRTINHLMHDIRFLCFITGDIFGDFDVTDDHINARDLKLLAPVDPPIILGTGLNYRKHAQECGMEIPALPFLAFFKQGGCVQHPNEPIRIPRVCPEPEVDWEVPARAEQPLLTGSIGRWNWQL